MAKKDRAKIAGLVVDRLESLHQAGVLQLPKVRKKQTPKSTDIEGVSVPVLVEAESTPIAPAASKPSGWKVDVPTSLFDAPEAPAKSAAGVLSLEVLQQQVAGCTRCNELASTRTQTVFGVGNPQARLCFLGEAPGADEDRTGIPFVGRGGQLLTKIIEACQLKREDIYILNMLKCRPPGNRNPLPHELANCRGYLENQLDLIRPEFICCLGAVASQNLLGTTVAIGKLRGKIHAFRGVKVVCTYHPAFLLRSPSFKKETWEDMKLLMREMGVEI
jgi:uracil-DNA glycosylase family 4